MERMRELSEDDATGSVAEIYQEIKEYYAAPYVSSLFRHLATYPGLLEWIWKITLPAFQTGLIQNVGWKRVDISALKPLTPLSNCLLYTSPSPRDRQKSRMPSSA